MACLGDRLPESLRSNSQSKQLNPAGDQPQVGSPVPSIEASPI